MILGRDGEIGPANFSTAQSKAIKGLRARHFMDEMKVDVEQIRFTFCASHDVIGPNLLCHGLTHATAPSSAQSPNVLGRDLRLNL